MSARGHTLWRPPLLIAGVLALLVVGAMHALESSREQRIGVPVPLPVYEIEAVSGTHKATLLNLPLPPIGVLGVPVPVDVDGDIIPDVTVSLSLVNVAGLPSAVSGLLTDPIASIGKVVVPNLEINRLLPGLPLTAVNPPLRINVKLRILDVGGSASTILRLGYDTGAGGSIPAKFKVVAGGLTDFFNPVTATVEAPGYEGPLTVVAGFEQGSRRADADLRFAPLPTGLAFSYGSDDAGEHILAMHKGAVGDGADKEVDLAAKVKLTDGDSLSKVDARVDRLPRQVGIVVRPAGGFDYLASNEGRLPDVRADVVRTGGGEPPLQARLDLESLPPVVNAEWALPEDGDAHFKVSAPLLPIGAVEARVANFLGAPTSLPSYVPGTQQHVDLRESADGSERLITGRVEKIVLTELTQLPDGLDAHFKSAGTGTPLELHASMAAVGDAKRSIEARSLISPLPADVTATMRDAGTDQATDPMVITYASSDSIEVVGRLEARDEGVSRTAACGAAGTICADLHVANVPTSITTTVARLGSAGDPTESRVAVDSVPRSGSAQPDVVAALTVGQADGSVVDADLSALSIPDHLRLRLAKTASGAMDRTEFHTCKRTYSTAACEEGTEGALGTFAFGVRSFTEAGRPAALPAPVLDRPEHLAVIGEGTDFEAVGQFTDIREVQYVAGEPTGLRVRAGAGKAFRGDIAVHDVDADSDDPDDHLLDLDADLTVVELPDELSICFRKQGAAAGSSTDAFTADCRAAAPFGAEVTTDESPLSIGYSASSTIDVAGHVRYRDQGRTTDVEPDDPGDDTTIAASLTVPALPEHLVTHLLVPEQEAIAPCAEDGPDDCEEPEPTSADTTMRAHFEAQTGPESIGFSASRITGGGMCMDPRTGIEAFCVSGTLADLPDRLDLSFDPSAAPTGAASVDATDNNLVLTTSGGGASLSGFDLSSVTPVANATPARSSVTQITGSLTQLPATVVAKIRMPQTGVTDDEPELSFEAEPALGTIDLGFQNFVAPDLFPPVPPSHVNGGTDYDQQVLVQVRGDRTKAHVAIDGLERAAFRPVRDAKYRPLGTKVFTLGFDDAGHTARAYLDIAKSVQDHLIADVVLPDLPRGVEACVRGERTGTAAPADGLATWCDSVDDAQGALRLEAFDGESGIDVDAFLRQKKAGAADIVATRLGIIDLPPVLQIALPVGDDADLDLQGFLANGSCSTQGNPERPCTRAGIGQVQVELSKGRDIEVDGWSSAASRPYIHNPLPHVPGSGSPFPAEASNRQHLAVAKADDILHVRGLLGDRTPGVAGSQLNRLRLLARPCPTPPNSPADYPYFPPTTATTTYDCLAAAFMPPASGDADPLDLSVAQGFQGEPGDIVRLHDAGLTDVPDWFQMTLSDTPTTAGLDEHLLPRCGPPVPGVEQACMPPLIRFDQPLPTAELFGAFDSGDAGVLTFAGAAIPEGLAPDFNAVPTSKGLRVRQLTIGPNEDEATTVRFRLALPQSFTMQQPQLWSHQLVPTTNTSGGVASESSKDVRLAYAVRDVNGAPANGALGDFSLYTTKDRDQEILITDPIDFTKGIPLPGELGLDIYQRDSTVQGRSFLQLDGRSSTVLNAALRMFDRDVRKTGVEDSLDIDAAGLEHMVLRLQNLQAVTPGLPVEEPSFRVRFERVGAPRAPPSDPGSGDYAGESHQQFIGTLDATIDLAPPPPDGAPVVPPARRLEAALFMDAPAIGLEVAGFQDVDTATASAPKAQITLDVFLDFDEFNVVIVDPRDDTDIKIESDLEASFVASRATNFRMRTNVAGLDLLLDGPPDAHLDFGPLDWNVEQFRVEKEADDFTGIQAEITFLPVAGLVEARFRDCPSGPDGAYVTEGMTLDGSDYWRGSLNLLADPRFEINVMYVPDIVAEILTWEQTDTAVLALLCAMDPGNYELIHHENPSAPVQHPGDPNAVVGHDVPPVDPHIPSTGPDTELNPPDATIPTLPPLTIPSATVHHMCGVHSGGTVRIDGIVIVADVANPALGPDGIPLCPAGQEGSLQVRGNEVFVNGVISASAIGSAFPAGVAPVGNGGGGFAEDQPGGAGSHGAGGYGPGGPKGMGGGGPAGGKAGGTIVIGGDKVDIQGFVFADGGAGGPGECGANNVYGSGGGSGGRVAISATYLTIDGEVSVNGGAGGHGYGGGGGGGTGVIELYSPIPQVAGGLTNTPGTGGTSCSPPADHIPASHPGGVYAPVIPDAPSGRILDMALDGVPKPAGWVTAGEVLSFGYEAHGAPGDYAFLCIVPRVGGVFTPPAETSDLSQAACGVDSARGGIALETEHTIVPVTASEPGIRLEGGCIASGVCTTGIVLDPGVYGAFIHVCTHSGGFRCGAIPEQPDYIFGVDELSPDVAITAPGSPTDPRLFAYTRNGVVPLQTEIGHLTTPEGAPIGRILCHIGGFVEHPTPEELGDDAYTPCPEGVFTRTFTENLSRLTVRVYDLAGNAGHGYIVVARDSDPPTTEMIVTPAPSTDHGGWLHDPPTITLKVRDPRSGMAQQAIAYRLDGAPFTIDRDLCTQISTFEDQLSCDIPATQLNDLGAGRHTVEATGVDFAGNRLTRRGALFGLPVPPSTSFKIDRLPPVTGGAVVAADPVGPAGWLPSRPLVSLAALDDPGGSGLVADPPEGAGIFYRLDGGDELPYEGPVVLERGNHQVCWRVVDVAGNAPLPAISCTPASSIDLDAPVVNLSVTPAAPDGAVGWYRTNPTVSVAVADAAPGAGVLPSDLMVSLDGAPFVTYTGPIAIAGGTHEVRAYATDRAGHRSVVVSRTLQVDLLPPDVFARVTPPAPARAGWWRRPPTLVLRAADAPGGAGLASVEYRIDGGAWKTYTAAVDLTSGRHTIDYRTTDLVGRMSATKQLVVPTDDGMPTARALSPNPTVWIRRLGPSTAKLNWQVGDDRSTTVRVTVLVVDMLGNTIRRLDGGTPTVAPGTTVDGFTAWDGKDSSGRTPIGFFSYRVVVTDSAGNRSQSGESRPIQIGL